jgi:tyrosinase
MVYTRTNVYANGGGFSDPTILWYARGVAAMKARQLADPTSWRFYAAIHGIDKPLWTQYGYLSSSDPMPTQAQVNLYWKQCQHGSWYFPPWHRGYLLALEATIRDAVISLGGPSDWALPYWNYFGPNGENQLPPAFASPDWPDGQGNNPLFVQQRWGPNNDGNVYVPLDEVNLNALTVPEFTGVASGGDPGFGGVDTGFSHGGQVHGDLETQPHDWVHGLVGGGSPQNPNLPGLMSDPDTAGLDPIFYLHHANIDRLWQVWIQGPVAQGNPTDPSWVNGPASVGQRGFAMPWPPSGTEWSYTPGDLANLASLDYVYDDVSAASVHPELAARLDRVAAAASAPTEGGPAVATPGKNVELVGANDQPLRIVGQGEVRTPVRLDQQAAAKVRANLAAAPAAATAAAAAPSLSPERVFLNLENVRGLADHTAFRVYVNVPEGASPADYPDRLAGNIALFGVRKATASDEEHAGAGLTFVLEITHIVQALHLENSLTANALEVRIVPIKPVPEEAQVSIGRVSVFRQGA